MAIFQTLTSAFKAEVLQGVHDFDTDTFMLALYTGAADLSATTTAYTATGEISGTGYVAGGQIMTGISVVTGDTPYVTFANVVWSPAAFTARGGLIYNATKANKAVAVLDFGTDKTAANTFTVQMPANTSSDALIRF